MDAYFAYGEKEIAYLKSRDKRLAEAIDALGHPERPVQADLFASVVNSIVGQQISTRAHATVWRRMLDAYGAVTAESMSRAGVDELQSTGITFRKAAYIHDFAEKVIAGDFDVDRLYGLPDEDVVQALSALRGVGRWTAEMIMLHCMQRPDILSFDDLGIQRGLRMLHHHKKIDRALFERYRKRYSPCGSVASIYLWAISAGAIPGLRDYAPPRKANGGRHD